MKSISIYGNCPVCNEQPTMFDKPIYLGMSDIVGKPQSVYQLGCVFCDLFTEPARSKQECVKNWKYTRDKKLNIRKMK